MNINRDGAISFVVLTKRGGAREALGIIRDPGLSLELMGENDAQLAGRRSRVWRGSENNGESVLKTTMKDEIREKDKLSVRSERSKEKGRRDMSQGESQEQGGETNQYTLQ